MTTLASAAVLTRSPALERGASAFGAAAIGVAVLAAILSGWMPLGVSIVSVFLFAGPHNWVEFRFFLSQMPAHWGPQRRYFLLAIGGVAGLSAGFIGMSIAARSHRWDSNTWLLASSSWQSALVLWVAALATGRGRYHEHDRWQWAWPVAFLIVSVVWLVPAPWDLAPVYLHPLVGFWFLDRLIRRRRPGWLGGYRRALAFLPVLLILMWWKLSSAPPLPGRDMLTLRIAQHAGAELLTGVSSHLLISTHTFLELLHYGVWIVAVPLIGLRTSPWDLSSVPLFRKSGAWAHAIVAVLAAGAVFVVLLWACFLANYPLTRDVYFTIAIAHVLAEVPFLVRTL